MGQSYVKVMLKLCMESYGKLCYHTHDVDVYIMIRPPYNF